jgi:hypothetical protein
VSNVFSDPHSFPAHAATDHVVVAPAARQFAGVGTWLAAAAAVLSDGASFESL